MRRPPQVKFISPTKHKVIALLNLLIASYVLIIAGKPALAQSTPTSKPTGKSSLSYLTKFDDGWKILREPKVKEKIRSTMGNKEKEFWSCTQLVSPPQVKNNKLLLNAYVRGLAPYMQSLFCLDLVTGKCWVGYLNDSKYHFYGADNFQNLPLPMQQYYKTLEHKTVSLSFEKANFKAPKKGTSTNRGKAATKPLAYKNPAGTWERVNGNEFDNATIEIMLPEKSSQNKIHFKIEAQSGANTGEAEGEVLIVDNMATYQSDSGTLHFHLAKKQVVITGNDSSFCGMGVTLLGTYKKVTEP